MGLRSQGGYSVAFAEAALYRVFDIFFKRHVPRSGIEPLKFHNRLLLFIETFTPALYGRKAFWEATPGGVEPITAPSY